MQNNSLGAVTTAQGWWNRSLASRSLPLSGLVVICVVVILASQLALRKSDATDSPIVVLPEPAQHLQQDVPGILDGNTEKSSRLEITRLQGSAPGSVDKFDIKTKSPDDVQRKPTGTVSKSEAEAGGPLKSSLQRWLDQNAGKRILLVQADNREFNTSMNISSSFVHSSLVGMRLWADMHGYAHVWIKGKPESPHGIKLANYWNKVPATMMGLRLARRSNISTIVFIDSDVVPVEFNVDSPFDCGLDGMLVRHNTSFAVSEDKEFWSTLLRSLKVYKMLAINSGIIMFDTSEHSEGLLKHWWLESINVSSPFEIQKGTFVVEFTLAVNTTTTSTLRGNPHFTAQSVAKKLNETLAVNLAVHTRPPRVLNATTALWSVGLSLHHRMAYPSGTYLIDAFHSCCDGQKACAQLVPPDIPVVEWSCKLNPASTLISWPGEQDRLNWLVTELFPGARIVPSLGICAGNRVYASLDRCFQHFCNRKHETVPRAVWNFVNRSTTYHDRYDWETEHGKRILKSVWTLETASSAYDADISDAIFNFEEL